MSNNEEKNLTPDTEETTEDTNFTEVSEEQETPAADTAEKDSQKDEKKKKNRTPEAEKERALNQVKRRKRLKYGTLATVITVIFIAVIIAVNIICGILDSRFNWNIDMTSSDLYEISPDTIDTLSKVDKDIHLIVLAAEDYFLTNTQLKVMAETIDRFKEESNGHITSEYVDMTKNPEIVRKYNANYNGDFSIGDTIVVCGELVRVIPFDDMIATEQSIDYNTYSYVNSYTFKGEQSLLSAVMGVTDLHPVKVAVIDKMGGNDIHYQYEMYNLQSLLSLLEKNNYQYDELDLMNDSVDPATYDMAILLAPYTDLNDTQVKKLNDFLYNDGQYNKQFVYFASVFQQDLKNLNDFLDTWGIEVSGSYVSEGNTNAAQQVNTALGVQPEVPVPQIQESDYSAKLANAKLPVVLPLARPLIQKYETNSGRTTEALLKTNDSTYLTPMDLTEEQAESFDPDQAEHGSYALAVMSTQNFTFDNVQHTSRLLAFSSSWMLDPYITQSKSYGNSDYLITVLNAMTGKEAVATIAEKSLNPSEISISAGQVKVIQIIVVFIIPLIVAVLGIVVFIRRKNK